MRPRRKPEHPVASNVPEPLHLRRPTLCRFLVVLGPLLTRLLGQRLPHLYHTRPTDLRIPTSCALATLYLLRTPATPTATTGMRLAPRRRFKRKTSFPKKRGSLAFLNCGIPFQRLTPANLPASLKQFPGRYTKSICHLLFQSHPPLHPSSSLQLWSSNLAQGLGSKFLSQPSLRTSQRRRHPQIVRSPKKKIRSTTTRRLGRTSTQPLLTHTNGRSLWMSSILPLVPPSPSRKGSGNAHV